MLFCCCSTPDCNKDFSWLPPYHNDGHEDTVDGADQVTNWTLVIGMLCAGVLIISFIVVKVLLYIGHVLSKRRLKEQELQDKQQMILNYLENQKLLQNKVLHV